MNRFVFGFFHGPEFQIGDGQGDDHDDGQNGVQIKRDGGDESAETAGSVAGVRNGGGHSRSPTGDRCNDTNRCRRTVDNVR